MVWFVVIEVFVFLFGVVVMCVVGNLLFLGLVDFGFVKIEKVFLFEKLCDLCWFLDCFYVGKFLLFQDLLNVGMMDLGLLLVFEMVFL